MAKVDVPGTQKKYSVEKANRILQTIDNECKDCLAEAKDCTICTLSLLYQTIVEDIGTDNINVKLQYFPHYLIDIKNLKY